MRKISSNLTFFYKRVFPILFTGVLAGLFVHGFVNERPVYLILLGILGSTILMKQWLWDLADEVFDGGDRLLVKNAGAEEVIPLTSIADIHAPEMMNPPRIIVKLIAPGRFGREIAFSPVAPIKLNPFAQNEIAESLVLRMKTVKSQRAV